MTSVKILLRAAKRLQAAWNAASSQISRECQPALVSLRESQLGLARALVRLDKARSHHLTLILPEIQQEVVAWATAVQGAAKVVCERMEQPAPEPPSLSTLLAELRQTEEEFGQLQIEWKQKFLAVTTESISLEGTYLGPFALQLGWRHLADGTAEECFEIVALDPNPAATDERVTHPHVKSRRLCAGRAAQALDHALNQGRLADAFCLVRSVLTHYNPGSPHVALNEWGGNECYDCGRSMGEESYDCALCGRDYCEECARNCQTCDVIRCRECLTACAVCDELFCDGCLQPSAGSARKCCASCLEACACCGAEVARDERDADTGVCCPCQLLKDPHPVEMPAPALAAECDDVEAQEAVHA
jgi:hypothetical protein